MKTSDQKKPTVLVFSGHDPSGAAGIQADIESIAYTGCHCASIITATTAQDTTSFAQLYPQDPDHFSQQTALLLSDLSIQACKIGLIGSMPLIEIIADVLRKLDGMPIVIDPILAAGTGKTLTDRRLQKSIIKHLFPHTTVLTPNSQEAKELTATNNIQAAATKLFEFGCKNVLITGADDDTAQVTNTLFMPNQKPVQYEWERLPHSFHGSGCTLSAAIAGFLAMEQDIHSAVEKAQAFTWESLKHGIQLGKGQLHPVRIFSDRSRRDKSI